MALDNQYAPGGQVQWDGTDVAVGTTPGYKPWILRFQVSASVGTLVGITKLKDLKSFGKFWLDGETLVLPFAAHRGGDPLAFGYWNYPKGGKPTKVFKDFKFKRVFVQAAISYG